MSSKVVLTGVQATGMPHVGNYIGAIKPALEQAAKLDKSFLFIADYHALNGLHNAAELRQNTYEVAATWLALGLDCDRTIFYRQSDVPEIFELSVILNAVTPKGLMDRSHAYKACVDKNRAAERDADAGVNMGLYTYPILMAADILAMQAQLIPVGYDQTQHIEFARDIAGYFNGAFSTDVLKEPEGLISESTSLIPGLDGRKMSKSYNNHIPLFIDAKQRAKLIMKIVTDSKLPEEPKDPNATPICTLYDHFADEQSAQELRQAFVQGGMGYGDAKKKLAQAIEEHLAPAAEIYQSYMSDVAKIDDILAVGAEKARKVARETLSQVRETIGVRGL